MASNGANWCKNEIVTHILHGEGMPVAAWVGYVLSIVIFCIALAARFIMLPVEGGSPFVTFYPAVIISSLLFGARPGLLTVALSTVAADYFFLPPYWSFALEASQVIPLMTFILSGGAICFLIYQMQRRAEELRQYKAIVDFSTDAIIGKTPSGIITSWNKGAERIYGYTSDEIIGKSVTILAPPASHPEIHELLEKIRGGIAVVNHDAERIRKDGASIQVALNLSPIRDVAGNITGISTIARDITEKKRLEEMSRLHSTIFGNLAEGIYLIRISDGVIVFTNPQFDRMFGYESGELLGKHVSIVNAPSEKSPEATATEIISELVRTGVWRGEVQNIRKNGAAFWCYANVTTFDHPQYGQVIVAVHEDITERKRVELEREQLLVEASSNAAEMTAILASHDDAILMYDKEMNVHRANPSFANDYGFDPVGLNLKDIIQRVSCRFLDGRPLVLSEQPTSRALHGEKVAKMYYAVIRGDGATAIVETSSRPMYVGDNIMGTVTVWHDITESKLNDAVNASRLHLVQFSLTHSLDELLEETLNEAEKLTGSVIGFYHFVEDDQISLTLQNWSTSTKAVFCKAEGKGLHYPIDEAGVWVDCVRQGKAVIHNDYASLPNRRGMPEGHATVIRELVVPVFRGKKISAILGVGNKPGNYTEKDVTTVSLLADMALEIAERKKAEDKINELNRDLEQRVNERTEQLEAANKELESFSYSVSHDLRSPLRAIDGFSHILLDDYADKLDEEGKRLLNVVRDNTNRMGQLIDDILKFSRTGRLEITFSEIDMEGLAREVVAELQPADGKLLMEIEHIPSAKGDRAMMHQVFVNLLSNAIKFSRFKNPAMIKVGGSIEGGEAIYYVRDNGAGFDMQYAEKLFGVFQRLHGVDEFEGTGIGLAIVKRIITRHGGRVWAEGKLNEGATIYFALPTKEKT